jgi:stage V sporulation protein SpoVS
MSDADRLTLADPKDVAGALASGLRYRGRKRVHDAGEIMAWIVAERLVKHLEQSGFVVMQKPPSAGGAPMGRGPDGR